MEKSKHVRIEIILRNTVLIYTSVVLIVHLLVIIKIIRISLSHKNLPGSQASFYNSVVQTEHSVIIKSLPLVTQLRQISLNTKQILKLQTKRRTQFSRMQRFVSKVSNHNQQDQTATEINATCIKTF